MKIKDNQLDARELHSKLAAKQDFSAWIKKKITDAALEEGKDFSLFKGKSSGGRPTIEYTITIDAAKEICLLQQTPEGHKLRKELIALSSQKENLELLTISQSALAHRLINCMRYIENAKKAEELHLNSFINNQPQGSPDGMGVLCAKFHQHRNAVLNMDGNYIDAKLREFCLENSRALPKSKSKSKNDKLMFMGLEYDVFRNAVFDLLKSKGTIDDISMKFANVVKQIAKESGEPLYRKNDDNLFHNKQNLIEPKDLLIPAKV